MNRLKMGVIIFIVKKKKESKGRNLATGDSMMLAPEKVITLQSSGKLREKIN